jgi:hypothetical protein
MHYTGYQLLAYPTTEVDSSLFFFAHWRSSQSIGEPAVGVFCSRFAMGSALVDRDRVRAV